MSPLYSHITVTDQVGRSLPPICFQTRTSGGTDTQCERLLDQIKRDHGVMPPNCYSMVIEADPEADKADGKSALSAKARSGFTAVNHTQDRIKTNHGPGQARSIAVKITIRGKSSSDVEWPQSVGEFKCRSIREASHEQGRNFGSTLNLEKAFRDKETLFTAFNKKDPQNPFKFGQFTEAFPSP